MTIFNFRKNFENNCISNLFQELENNPELIALYFSELAYHSPNYIYKLFHKFDVVNFSIYNTNDVQVFLVEFDEFAIVGFRGTQINKLNGVISDLIFWKTKFQGIHCHKGFVDAILRVSDKLENDLQKLNSTKKLLFTGHSLGGAMAILFSLKILPTHLITFGSPKVSSGEDFHNKLCNIETHLRIEIQSDLVPKLPCLMINYEHTGKQILLPSTKGLYNSHRLETYINHTLENSKIQFDKSQKI